MLTNVQAVLVFNTGTALLNVTIDLADLGLQGCAAAPLHCRSVAVSPLAQSANLGRNVPGRAEDGCVQCSARDVWAHRDVPSSFSSTWTVTDLGAHDSVFYKFTISDAQSK